MTDRKEGSIQAADELKTETKSDENCSIEPKNVAASMLFFASLAYLALIESTEGSLLPKSSERYKYIVTLLIGVSLVLMNVFAGTFSEDAKNSAAKKILIKRQWYHPGMILFGLPFPFILMSCFFDLKHERDFRNHFWKIFLTTLCSSIIPGYLISQLFTRDHSYTTSAAITVATSVADVMVHLAHVDIMADSKRSQYFLSFLALLTMATPATLAFLPQIKKSNLATEIVTAISSIITVAETFMAYKEWHHIEVSKKRLVNISLALLHTLDGFASLSELAFSPSKEIRSIANGVALGALCWFCLIDAIKDSLEEDVTVEERAPLLGAEPEAGMSPHTRTANSV